MQHDPRAGAVLLAALALLPVLTALAPMALAVGEQLTVQEADVLMGQPFHVQLQWGVGESSEQVHVGCDRCGAGWTATLNRADGTNAAGQRVSDLTFPRDFPGAAGEPRFATNYTVTVPSSPVTSASVAVHLTDDWLHPDGVPVTDGVHIQLAGMDPGSTANVTIRKWTRTGALRDAGPPLLLRADRSGVASFMWRIPKEQASDMDCPAIGWKCRNYTVRAVLGDRVETSVFQARPAQLQTSIVYLADAPGPPAPLLNSTLVFNRTGNVTVGIDVRYLNGAPLTDADRHANGSELYNGTLKLAVESVAGAQGNEGPAQHVAWLWAKLTERGWRATWPVPWNLTTTVLNTGNPQYRIRLVPQEDVYGNLVPETNGTGFAVSALTMQPVPLRGPPAQVERLVNATAVWRIAYADGQPFDANGNATARGNTTTMRGWLLDANGDKVQQLTPRNLGRGVWRLDFQADRKFAIGTYQLRLDSATDNPGNQVAQADTAAFTLVPAKPRVELLTRVDGVPRDNVTGFQRGERVTLDATIRYADGSPFTRDRLPGGDGIAVNVSELDAQGNERARERLTLGPVDDQGHWSVPGAWPLGGFTDAVPLGNWTFTVDVKDKESVPNANLSVSVRPVRGASLGVEVTRQPEPNLRAGDAASVRFHVAYPDGSPVDGKLATGRLRVTVRPWEQGALGENVSVLVPAWDPDAGEWAAQWPTNATTLVGTYELAILGGDAFGNVVQATPLRHVAVYVDTLQRQVLRDAPDSVRRGEVVLVVFDGAQGDTGEVGFAAPRIEVQKWNPVRQAWEKELTDVLVNSTDGSPDHWGKFVTDEATNLGTYRLVLHARNDQRASVVAYSRAFQVLPVQIEREWLGGAASNRTLAKGEQLTLQLGREDGDQVDAVRVLRFGETVANGTALLRPGRYDVAWRTGYRLPAGPYTVVVRGHDVHNNSFASPPLEVNLTGVELGVRVPGPPDAAVRRAEPLSLRVLLQFPDQLNVRTGQFTARFLLDRSGAEVGSAPLAVQRAGWLVNWTPPADAPLGRYRVVLDGDDGLGDVVTAQEAFGFQLAEGVLHRAYSFERSAANRTELVVWALPAQPGNDTEMHFTLRDEQGGHRDLDAEVSDGAYLVRWRPARDERLGRYTLEASGMDGSGNAILAVSRPLALRPAQVGVVPLSTPGSSLKPGEQGRWVFQLQYADGSVLPADAANRPQIAMLSGDKVAEPAPELSVENGRWVATWTPVAGKHIGVFRIAVGGRDQFLNEVQLKFLPTFRIDQGALKDILGVPGFEAALLPVAVLGAALLARRRT